MSAIIFDTETTDADEPQIVQAAWLRVEDTSLEVVEKFEQSFRPGKPISLGAMAVHHITDEDLEGCAPHTEFRLPACDYLIGHNVDFDWKAALASGDQPQFKRICTLALSRSLWPALDSHKQGAVLYHLDRLTARQIARDAHDALADVSMLHVILGHIIARLSVTTWEALWQASEKARVPTVMAFGKHKGMRIADLPRDYRDWLLRQPDLDPYMKQALRAR